MIIRAGTKEDLPSLAELMNTCCVQKRNFSRVCTDALEKSLCRSGHLWLDGLLLAMIGDRIIGACHALYEPHDRQGYIAYLLALPELQDQLRVELLRSAENALQKARNISFGSPHTPHYHAVEGRFEPLWGSTEVMELDAADHSLVEFLKTSGYTTKTLHATMIRNLSNLAKPDEVLRIGELELLEGDDCWYNAYSWYGKSSGEEFGLRNKDLKVLVLRHGHKVLGHIAWYPMRSGKRAAICDLEVARNYRGQGLGKYLLNLALIDIEQVGFESVELFTSESLSPTGYALYLKQGFTLAANWLELSKPKACR